MRILIGTVVAVAVLCGALLAPFMAGADVRRTMAVKAVRIGVPALGVALLRPLARAGDAVSQNNLAILLNNGVGTNYDVVEAARLMNAAAAQGLPRAQLNLTLLRRPCSAGERDPTMVELQRHATAGDRRAASLLADCLIWFLPGPREGQILLFAAEKATATADPDEELKFGWLLQKQASRNHSSELNQQLVNASARYLLRAAEHGRPAAYEGMSLLAKDFSTELTDPAIAGRVRARTPTEWIDTAANAGHPRSRCKVGVDLATQLSQRGTKASDAERARLRELFQTCLKDRDPREIAFRNGKEETRGHYPLYDVWMHDDAFLVASPRYENYDHDVMQQDSANRIATLSRNL